MLQSKGLEMQKVQFLALRKVFTDRLEFCNAVTFDPIFLVSKTSSN